MNLNKGFMLLNLMKSCYVTVNFVRNIHRLFINRILMWRRAEKNRNYTFG